MTSPLDDIVMPAQLRSQAEQMRTKLHELYSVPTSSTLSQQLMMCADKLGETVSIFASVRLHTAAARQRAESALAEQLLLIADEVDRLATAIDTETLSRQDVHGNYLRDAFGVSALSLKS